MQWFHCESELSEFIIYVTLKLIFIIFKQSILLDKKEALNLFKWAEATNWNSTRTLCSSADRHTELRAVIKWKYHVLLTRIQIENRFNQLTSVCINARENAAYVTNPLSDCAKKSEYVSAFVFDSPFNPQQAAFSFPSHDSKSAFCPRETIENMYAFIFYMEGLNEARVFFALSIKQ